MSTLTDTMDDLTEIIAYENGELDTDQQIALFANLVKTGMAWSHQGCYGRAAQRLIDAGIISRSGEVI